MRADRRVTSELIEQARRGDEQAFGQLVDPYRSELQVHCYRFLGSLQDAEDALQETLLAAWQGLASFEERASLRTWLYRIATNRCLNWLRSASRRPRVDTPASLPVEPPEPTRLGEVIWLEPFPDVLLPGVDPGPEARYEAKEAISLAFITALQLLSPRQRAALILRDVLGFRAAEVAEILGTTEESVTSALKRARATLSSQEPKVRDAPAPAQSEVEQALSARFVSAFENGDVDAIMELLTEDTWLRMPPMLLEYQGRELAGKFLATMAFRDNRQLRLVPARANCQPAFGVYLRDLTSRSAHAHGLFVITVRGGKISAITVFGNTSLLSRFGLARTLAD
jgi:RNA polymerase sigma-70 factor, ECF subfamily